MKLRGNIKFWQNINFGRKKLIGTTKIMSKTLPKNMYGTNKYMVLNYVN